MERIIASNELKRASRLADFLTYIVEEALQGREDRIKAYSIGIEVFGRDASFDPQFDPVVRIEAGRLRRELEHYYLTAGRNDPVGIDIPKGAYIPRFFYRLHVDRPVEPDASHAPAMTAPERQARSLTWPHWRWAGAAAVIMCLFGLVWAGQRIERQGAAEPSRVELDQPAILVLPFADLGGGVDVSLRAAAISEELKARLVRFREVTVVTPDAQGLADSKTWPAARYILDGSVRADDTRLRTTVRLVDRTNGTVLWSEIYDVDPKASDFIDLEQDIASKVATAVAQPYGVLFQSAEQDRGEQSFADEPESYRCALNFYEYRRVLGAEGHLQVRNCLENTIAATPNNSTAWAMLSYIYLDEDRYGFNAILSPPPVGRALQAAQRAVQLDPANVRALQAMMTVRFFNREPQVSLRYGEQAYRLNPNDTDLLGEYGSRLMQAGEHQRGMAMMQDALTRNPSTTGLYSGLLALGAYLEGDDPRALTLIRQADLQRFPIYHFVATLIYARNGLADEMASSRTTFLEMRPAFFTRFDIELDRRNFNAADRARLIAGAREAGFPVPSEVPAASDRTPVPRSH